ncbi:MAG: NAD(P)-dependent oxidoreductase [Candidatus Dormibacteraeota bacterium]|nr:NAD(P)-dependent oxidoreductase [Candidatus Dormibacteraeota bacterium]
MRVVVIGGTGILGRRVVRRLLDAGHDVAATARDDASRVAFRDAGVRPLEMDVYDRASIIEGVRGSDAVVRLTTETPTLAHMRRPAAWVETGRLRTESASLIADACLVCDVGAYLHESISLVYADHGDEWIDETSPVDVQRVAPLHDAWSGEAAAERITAAGGRGVVLRFAGFYSEDSTQSIALATALQHRRVTLFGRARNYHSSIHVDDAATAAAAALTAPAGVYNVADLEPVRYVELIALLAVAIEAPPLRRLPKLMAPSLLGVAAGFAFRSLRVSSRKLREATGWSPTVQSVRQGWELVAQQWALESQR